MMMMMNINIYSVLPDSGQPLPVSWFPCLIVSLQVFMGCVLFLIFILNVIQVY